MEIDKITLKNGSATVLIVEDRPMNLMLLEVMLNRLNHKAICASNGLDAMELLEKTPVDLVISDIYMPEMGGFALMEKIRSKSGYAHIPVILMTDGGNDVLSGIANSKGADGFLGLPFSTSELKQLIDQLIVPQKLA